MADLRRDTIGRDQTWACGGIDCENAYKRILFIRAYLGVDAIGWRKFDSFLCSCIGWRDGADCGDFYIRYWGWWMFGG